MSQPQPVQKSQPERRDQGMRGLGMHRPLEKPKNAGRTLRQLLQALAEHRWLFFLGLVMTIASSISSIVATYYLKPIINGLVDGFDIQRMLLSILQMALIYAFGVAAHYGSNLLMAAVAQRTSHRIRKNLFEHMQELPLAYFDSKSHGELMSRFTNDVDNVNVALEQSLSNLVTSTITVAGTFVMMLVISPLLTVLIVLMLLLMIFIIKVVGRKSALNFRRQQKELGEVNGYIEEMMEGQKVVKVFNYERKAKETFSRHNEALRLAATDAQTYAGIMMPIMGNLSYVNYGLTAMFGAMMAIRGLIDIGSIAAFLQYTRSFAFPITQIAGQFNTLLAALAGAERIFELQGQQPETDSGTIRLVRAEKLDDGQLRPLAGPQETGLDNVWAWLDPETGLTELRGEVHFNDVVFGYLPEQEVLHGISLYARPGQKIAFVGSTGAGKTTITNLINRFYELRDGSITFDDIDIRKINKQDLRRTLGMVLQDVHLFQGTIRDNIRYGRLDASDDEIIQAAITANAHVFISNMPDGYDTWLEPDGTNLSQGQRQLLSIARAAAADPPVLILDEATSSVDTRTERLIEQGMDRLMQGRTTFVIAHRLSTVRRANAILVLEDGQIIERGDHEDLLELKGRYYQLCTGMSELA